MAEKIVMLALSPTMENGTITSWRKKEGDVIKSADVLCDVETDKATMEYEAISEGTLLKIITPEGSKVRVGETIAIAGSPGEDISALLTETGSAYESSTPDPSSSKTVLVNSASAISKEMPGEGEHLPDGIKASPLARELAREKGINLHIVKGSGPGGRIIKDDVEKAEKTGHIPEEKPATYLRNEKKLAVSEKRRSIASRLSQSKVSSPHYYVTVDVCMDTVLEERKRFNEKAREKISLNACFIKFAAEALRRHPRVNSSWTEDYLIQHSYVDIGLAVAQTDGLITPVIRDCTEKGVAAIDRELQPLVERARLNTLQPDEYTGATFTISNLGSYGISEFTAIINPPGSAILAIGEISRQPVVVKENAIEIKSIMKMTLSCDHRVIDGAVAAQFMHDLKEFLEHPIEVLY